MIVLLCSVFGKRAGISSVRIVFLRVLECSWSSLAGYKPRQIFGSPLLRSKLGIGEELNERQSLCSCSPLIPRSMLSMNSSVPNGNYLEQFRT